MFPLILVVIGFLASIFYMTNLGDNWTFRFTFLTILFYSIGQLFFSQAGSWQQNNPNVAITAYRLNYWSDAANSIALSFMTMAFFHPSIQEFNFPFSRERKLFRMADLVLICAAFVVIPGGYWLESLLGREVNLGFVIGSMVFVFFLVVARLSQLLQVLQRQNGLLDNQQKKLQYQAFHDPLTELPNRSFFYSRLTNAVKRARETQSLGAVFMIDLDQFKMMNDNFGHDQGDLALQEISRQLMQLKRSNDFVARWGGDEFVFILESLKDAHDALSFANRLATQVYFTAGKDNLSVTVTLSIGISLFPVDTEDGIEILKKADIALYRAKESRNRPVSLYLGE